MVETAARRGSGRAEQQALARVVIHEPVLRGILAHAASDTTRELGGVLIGSLHGDAGQHAVEVSGWIPARHTEASRTSVTFTSDTWAAVHEEKERRYPNERIVGWYHTHPNLGIFLSPHDTFIHRNFFREPWQVALVVDPVRDERGFFVWLREGDIRAVSYFILAGVPGASRPSETEAPQVGRAERLRELPTGVPAEQTTTEPEPPRQEERERTTGREEVLVREAASRDAGPKRPSAERSREEALRRLEAARAYARVQRSRIDPLSLALGALTVALAVGVAVSLVSLVTSLSPRGARSRSSEDEPWAVQVEQIRAEMVRSQSQLHALQSEMDALRTGLVELQKGAGDVRERLGGLGAGLDEVRAGVQEVRAELEQLRRDTDEMRDRAVRVHVVQRGDTLWTLSQRYYGSPDFVNLLMRANDIPRDGRVRAGRMIVVPAVEGSGS